MTLTTSSEKSLFFNPLKSPFLWAFTSVHLIFAILLGDIHAFAPDENLYMRIAQDVYQSGYSTENILGWHNTQVWFLRVAYFPVHMLTAIGIPNYLAIRFESVLLCTIAVYLLLCILRANPSTRNHRLLIAFLLIPSCFIWMTLGLRECFIYISLALICTGFVTFMRKEYRISLIFLTLGNLTLFQTKEMLFALAFGALTLALAFSVVKARGLKKAHGVILASILIPMIIYPLGTRTALDTLRNQAEIVVATGQAEIAVYAELVDSAQIDSGASTSDVLRREIQAQPNNMIVRILKITGLDQKFLPVVSQVEGESTTGDTAPPVAAPRSSKLDVVPASISDPASILSRTAGFLFTPFPLTDNGSFFANVIALEAPLWWLFYIAVGIAIWRRFSSRSIDELTVFALSFSAVFLLYSALTEINVGTLTRHRSVLLIPGLFLILSTSRKSKSVK